MNRLLGFGLALASLSLADKPLGQYSGTGGFGGGFGDDPGYEGGAGGDNLEEVIPGVPGDDYPIFAEVPDTSFLCDGQVDGGYYADPEADCQAFHICAGDGTGGLTRYSFLCPNGTLFNQQYFVCDWWFNVDCSLAEQFWSLNDQVAAERAANSPPGTAPGDDAQFDQPAGGRGGQQAGRGGSGGRRGGTQASASAPRGSYSAPDSFGSGAGGFGGDSSFGSADAGYGAPGDFGSSAPLSGYGSRRRNARGLELSEAVGQEEGEDLTQDLEY